MKNKLLKFSISVPVALSLFFAQGASASTVINFDSAGNGIAIDNSQISGVSFSDVRTHTCVPSGYATLYHHDSQTQTTYIVATSSYSSAPSCTYLDGTYYHYDGGAMSFSFYTNPTLVAGDDYSVSISGDIIPNSAGTGNWSAPSPVVLSFRYPVDSTSINTDFSSFQVYVQNTDPTRSLSFQPQIIYSRHADFSYGLTLDFPLGPNIVAPATTSQFSVLKNQALFSNSTYYAKIIDLYSGASSTISWTTGQLTGTENTNLISTFGPPGTVYSATSTMLDLNSTSSPFYVDCSNAGGGSIFSSSTVNVLACYAQKTLYSVVGFLVVPPDFVQSYLNNSVSSMKSAFPFSLVYGVVGKIQANTTSTPVNYADLNISVPQIGLSVTPLSSSTLENVLTTAHCDADCAKTRHDFIFNIISSIIWIGVATKLILLVV